MLGVGIPLTLATRLACRLIHICLLASEHFHSPKGLNEKPLPKRVRKGTSHMMSQVHCQGVWRCAGSWGTCWDWRINQDYIFPAKSEVC